MVAFTTHFKPFSRYRPFRFEVDLDAIILTQFLDCYPTAAPTGWKPTLNAEYNLTGSPYSSEEEADFDEEDGGDDAMLLESD